MSFQKSTFLIGEELGNIRDIIGKFFSSFNKIIKENKLSIDKIKTISIIKEKLNQIDEIEKTISNNQTEISEINTKIDSLNQQIKNTNQELTNIKNTQEYIEQINQKKEIKELDTKLVIEYQSLKEILDFKVLAKIYHSIEGKMDLIKQYKENFKQAFEKYSQEKFLDLINIKQINQEQVKQRLESINTIKQEIKNITNNQKQDPTSESEIEIQTINRKIKELNPEITKKEKLIQKFQQSQKQIKQEIIEKLEEIKVIVEN
jgi:chromosome segregation ATPase